MLQQCKPAFINCHSHDYRALEESAIHHYQQRQLTKQRQVFRHMAAYAGRAASLRLVQHKLEGRQQRRSLQSVFTGWRQHADYMQQTYEVAEEIAAR